MLELNAKKGVALDAADTYFLGEELQAMQKKSFAVLRSPLSAERLISANGKDDEGADFHVYTMYDGTGKAQSVSSLDNAFPMANVKRERIQSPYDSHIISAQLTIQDMRASKMALLDYAQAKVNSALRAIRKSQNDMAFYGDPAMGIEGWFNIPNINKAAVAGGTWTPAKAADDILADMTEIITATEIATDGLVKSDSLLMPVAQHAYIRNTPRAANNDTTILEYFLSNNPGVNVYSAWELKGAFTGGADGMIAYSSDPEWFYQLISIDFLAHPPLQKTNLTELSFETRMGGTKLIYPESQQFRYGI